MIGKRRKPGQSVEAKRLTDLREPGKPLHTWLAGELGVSGMPFVPKALRTFTVKDRRERNSKLGFLSRKKILTISGKPRNIPDLKSIAQGLFPGKRRK